MCKIKYYKNCLKENTDNTDPLEEIQYQAKK